MQKSSLLFFVHFFILLGCTFAPKDKYVSPISQPSSIKVSADIQDPNFKDPFSLNLVTTFNFKIDSTTKPILDSQVLLDGVAITGVTVTNMLLSFTIDPSKLSDGNHTVQVMVKLDPKSGSLANQLGVEYYLVEKDFTVVVDKTLPVPTQPLTLAMENGYLTLQWEKFPKTNFSIRVAHQQYGDPTLYGDSIISDPTITKFIDYGYTGGNYHFSVQIVNSSDSKLVGSSDFNLTPAIFKLSYDNNFAESISWDQTLINSTNTTMEFESLTWSNTSQFSSGNMVGDTIPFGNADAVAITIYRPGFPKYKYVTDVVFQRPRNLPSYISYFKSLVQPNFFVGTNSPDLIRLSSSLLREDSATGHSNNIRSLAYPKFTISSSGTSGLAMDGNTGALYQFNPYDLSTITQLSSSPIKGYNNINSGILGVLTNNDLVGVNFNYGSYNTVAAAWDLNLGKVVWSDTLDNPRIDAPVLSADGSYLAINTKSGNETNVFHSSGGTWTLVGKVAPGSIFFRNNSTTELIITGADIKIYELTSSPDSNGNFAPVRTFTVDLGQGQTLEKIGYDEVTQNVFVELITTLRTNANIFTSKLRVFEIQNFSYQGSGTAIINGGNHDHFYSNGYHFINSYAEKIK